MCEQCLQLSAGQVYSTVVRVFSTRLQDEQQCSSSLKTYSLFLHSDTHHRLRLQWSLCWEEEQCQYLIYEDLTLLYKMVTWCQNTFACASVWMSMCVTGRLAEGQVGLTVHVREKNLPHQRMTKTNHCDDIRWGHRKVYQLRAIKSELDSTSWFCLCRNHCFTKSLRLMRLQLAWMTVPSSLFDKSLNINWNNTVCN